MTDQTINIKKNILQQALLYQAQGWSVIPVGPNKIPVIPWVQFQQEIAGAELITKWFTKDYPEANIGIVTGKLSGFLAVDIDPRHGGTNDAFKDIKTVRARTGGGGEHILFKYEEGIKNKITIKPGIDIRGEGGYIVVAPSVHSSGGIYEWTQAPGTVDFAPLPMFVKDWIKESDGATGTIPQAAYFGVPDGERNVTGASVIGTLLQALPLDKWDIVAWPLFVAWNEKNKPPMKDEDLRKEYDSIKQREMKSREEEKESIAGQVIKALIDEHNELFHDQHNESYIRLTNQECKIVKIRSKAFKKWISHYIWEKFKKLLPTDKLSTIIQILDGKATYDGNEYSLSVRITRVDGDVWYQLSESKFVKVNTTGWEIVDDPPILFKRFTHQKDQVIPQDGGPISDLCNFVNLKTDAEKLLFQIFIIASYIPGFPHPILVLFGSQGSGKTTPFRVIKSLVDPSVLRTLSAPDNEREFVQMASHHYFFFLDNLSAMPNWLSDALARASTGDGFVKRELYSDDDDVIYSFQRSMGINGINLVVQKADLLERSVLLSLERIPKEKRKEEATFWQEFDDNKPYLLGAIFSTLARALNEYENVQLSGYPRMADFARWGCAIARAIGYTDSDFMNAYYSNISTQSDAALDASLVGTAVIEMMSEREEWQGTAAELLTTLEGVSEKLKINIKGKEWPKNPSWLIRQLQLVIPNLQDSSISVTRNESARPKTVLIKRIPNSDVIDDAEQQDSQKPQDGTLVQIVNGDKENIATEQPASSPSSFSESIDKGLISRVKRREECPEMSETEYGIYLNREWDKIEDEKRRGLY